MLYERLDILLPLVSLAIFVIAIVRHASVQTLLLFVAFFLPLMDFKVATEDYGGFKVFDVIVLISLLIFFRKFTALTQCNNGGLYTVLVLCLIFLVFFGVASSQYSNYAFLKTVRFVPIFIYSRFLLLECIADRGFHLKILKALKVSFAISLAFLLFQMIFGLGVSWYPTLNLNTYEPELNIYRYPGIFYDPQANGQFLAMGFFISLVRVARYSKRYVLFDYAILLFTVYGIVQTGSRSSLLGLLIGFLIMIFLLTRRLFFTILISIWILQIGIKNSNFSFGVFSRIGTVANDFEFRNAIWQEALQIFRDQPILGIGWGNYQSFITKYYQDQYLETGDQLLYFDQPENGYLKILVEMGIIGAAIMFFLLLMPIIRSLTTLSKFRFDINIVFLLGALFAWLTAFSTVYSLFDARIQILVASILTLLIIYPRQSKLNDKSDTPVP